MGLQRRWNFLNSKKEEPAAQVDFMFRASAESGEYEEMARGI